MTAFERVRLAAADGASELHLQLTGDEIGALTVGEEMTVTLAPAGE